MTLLERTTTYRRETATRANRKKSERVDKRTDEIAVVAEIETDYQRADRVGDQVMIANFKRLYRVADDEEEREAVTRSFMDWQHIDKTVGQVVSGSVEDAVTFLRDNNDYWLPDGCGPDGRAA